MQMWPGFGEHMGLMVVWWLLALVLLVAVAWAIVRMAGTGGPGGGDQAPEAILKRRYARGEVDREEYERRLSDLRK